MFIYKVLRKYFCLNKDFKMFLNKNYMCFLKLNMYFYFVVLIELNVQCSSLVGKFDNLFEYILKIIKYEL